MCVTACVYVCLFLLTSCVGAWLFLCVLRYIYTALIWSELMGCAFSTWFLCLYVEMRACGISVSVCDWQTGVWGLSAYKASSWKVLQVKTIIHTPRLCWHHWFLFCLFVCINGSVLLFVQWIMCCFALCWTHSFDWRLAYNLFSHFYELAGVILIIQLSQLCHFVLCQCFIFLDLQEGDSWLDRFFFSMVSWSSCCVINMCIYILLCAV